MSMPSTSVTRSPTKYPPPPPRKRSIKTKSTKYNPTVWTMDNLKMSITSDIDHSDVDLSPTTFPKSAPVSPMLNHFTINGPSQSLSPHSHHNPHIKSKNRSISSITINTNTTNDDIDTYRPTSPVVPSIKSVNKHKAKLTKQRRRKKRRKYKKQYCYDFYDSSSDSDNEINTNNKRRRHVKQGSVPNLDVTHMHMSANNKNKNHRNGTSYKLRVIKDEKRINKNVNQSKLRHIKSMKSKQRLDRNNSLQLTNVNYTRCYRVKSVPLNVENKSYWSNANNYNVIKKKQRKKVKSDKIHMYKKYSSAVNIST